MSEHTGKSISSSFTDVKLNETEISGEPNSSGTDSIMNKLPNNESLYCGRGSGLSPSDKVPTGTSEVDTLDRDHSETNPNLMASANNKTEHRFQNDDSISVTEQSGLSATSKVSEGTPEVDIPDNEPNLLFDDQEDLSYAINGSCYYVNGKVDIYNGKFLIDTGSSISVSADKVLQHLSSVMCFGLKNAPSSYSRLMENVLKTCSTKNVWFS